MYKHILFPVDESDLSVKAEKECFAFARSIGAKITALHVVEHRGVAIDEAMTSGTFQKLQLDDDEAAKKSAEDMLDRLRERARASGVDCASVVVPGDEPSEEISGNAQRLGCDVIVMASHRRGGLEGLLRGSETAKVLTRSRLPVLVVR